MHKLLVCLGSMCVAVPLSGFAQEVPARERDIGLPAASSMPYDSAFRTYRAYKEEPVSSWIDTNRAVTPAPKREPDGKLKDQAKPAPDTASEHQGHHQ